LKYVVFQETGDSEVPQLSLSVDME
jgi:hypothetical protein